MNIIDNNDNKSDWGKKKLIYAVFFPLLISFIMTLFYVVEIGMDWDFHFLGIYPRKPESILSIFTYVFVHADIGHLFNNILSFVILGSLLFYFYAEIAAKVLFLCYLFSGILLWFIGRESWHIGASGLIYALVFFIFFSGIIRKHIQLIALSLIVIFVYGNMIWHVFPWQVNDPISWEGHLSGGFVGIILTFAFRNLGPQKLIKQWEEEMEEDDDENANKYIDETEEVNYQNDTNQLSN